MSRRLLASLIDGVVTVTPVVLATGGGVWLYLWYDRRRSGSDAAKGPNLSPGDGPTEAFRRFAEKIRLAQLEKNHRRREAGVKRASIEGQYGRIEKSDEIQFVDAYVSASVKIATQASRASR